MSLDELRDRGLLKPHRTSRQEIADLMSIVEVGLSDARAETISLDRRFSAAYDAARSLATIVLAAGGYRTTGMGQHATTFEATPSIMGDEVTPLSIFFDACRTKRNVIEYRRAGQVTESEVLELIEMAEEFRGRLLAWLRENYPGLVPESDQGAQSQCQ